MITRSDVSLGKAQGTLATCNVCGKEAPYKNMPKHVEANHITGVSHECDICGKISRSVHGLRQHMKAYHQRIHSLGIFVIWNLSCRTRHDLRMHKKNHHQISTENKELFIFAAYSHEFCSQRVKYHSRKMLLPKVSQEAMTSRAFSKPSRVGQGSEKLLVTRVITSRVVKNFFVHE